MRQHSRQRLAMHFSILPHFHQSWFCDLLPQPLVRSGAGAPRPSSVAVTNPCSRTTGGGLRRWETCQSAAVPRPLLLPTKQTGPRARSQALVPPTWPGAPEPQARPRDPAPPAPLRTRVFSAPIRAHAPPVRHKGQAPPTGCRPRRRGARVGNHLVLLARRNWQATPAEHGPRRRPEWHFSGPITAAMEAGTA